MTGCDGAPVRGSLYAEDRLQFWSQWVPRQAQLCPLSRYQQPMRSQDRRQAHSGDSVAATAPVLGSFGWTFSMTLPVAWLRIPMNIDVT